MKNDISDQLAVLFNPSFSCGSFPTILGTSKVTIIDKKDSKLKYSNHKPVSISPNIDKTLERIVCSRSYKYLEDNKLIFNLQLYFDKNAQRRML